jgi:hypothetical protein
MKKENTESSDLTKRMAHTTSSNHAVGEVYKPNTCMTRTRCTDGKSLCLVGCGQGVC